MSNAISSTDKKTSRAKRFVRDGTSQKDRLQAALQPDYIAIDEHSNKDLLQFAQRFAQQLQYVNLDNEISGNWQAFFGDDFDIDETLAFMDDPNSVTLERRRHYQRPHFALFLSFLKLLEYPRQQMNTLTKRHLQFYYHDILGLKEKPAQAASVHLLLRLRSDLSFYRLPKGTRFAAGNDAADNARFYQSDHDVMLSQARIAKVHSCYVDWQTTSLTTARYHNKGSPQEGIMSLLNIALGEPEPGDDLPDYDGKAVDFSQLQFFYTVLRFIRPKKASGKGLYLDYAGFRKFMALIQQCEETDKKDWQSIHTYFKHIANTATTSNTISLSTDLSITQDFDGEFFKALGINAKEDQARFFDGITQVESFYDVYIQRSRQTVQDFINTQLFISVADFIDLMQLKLALAARWASLLALLQQAGQTQRQDQYFQLSSPNEFYSAEALQDSLEKSLPHLDFNSLIGINDLDDLYTTFEKLQAYFFLKAEKLDYLLTVFMQEVDTDTRQAISSNEWEKVYAVLEKAHQEKVYQKRQDSLAAIYRHLGSNTHAFAALLAYALGARDIDDRVYYIQEQLETISDYLTPNSDEITRLVQLAQLSTSKTLSDAEINVLCAIVERAQRRYEHYEVPPPEKREWRNLYPLPDARQAINQQTLAPTASAYWHTFGQAQRGLKAELVEPLSLGWAISSPLLALREGKRDIQLHLSMQPNTLKVAETRTRLKTQTDLPFRLFISTTKGWYECDFELRLSAEPTPEQIAADKTKTRESGTLTQLLFSLSLDEQADALAAPPADSAIDTSSPVLKIVLQQYWQAEQTHTQQENNEDTTQGYYRSDYQPFKSLALQQLDLMVTVQGLLPQAVQNDEQDIDPKKPFYPFGLSPSAGSRLYITDPELCQHALDYLSLELEWIDLPNEGLNEHYKNYPYFNNKALNSNSFNSSIQLVDKGLTLDVNNKAVFFAKDTEITDTYHLNLSRRDKQETISERLIQSYPNYLYTVHSDYTYEKEVRQSSRYWQWQLNAPDFQHQLYPRLANEKALALSVAMVQQKKDIKAEDYHVNTPYTPKLKGLCVNYQASLIVNFNNEKEIEENEETCLYHLHPFGYTPCQYNEKTGYFPWLPQYDNEGQLYIGLSDVTTPQRLSLLFQMAEGTANPDLSAKVIDWHYLSDNRWLPLEKGQTIIDHTQGLAQSGIIQFDLPRVKHSTLLGLDSDLYYLRASMAKNTGSVCHILALESQAVIASLVASENAAIDLLINPYTIKALAETQTEIVAVEQPYKAFGGNVAEQSSDFYTRISERLRHKQRALTPWDYEHLVLAQFPEVYKTKCLSSHRNQKITRKRGTVNIVVIPDIRHRLPFDPFAPKIPASLLTQIQDYLQQHSSPFSKVSVKNAHYVAVKTRFSVRFNDPLYNDLYKQQLNDALNRFLSPWAYEEGADIVIGGEIYANSIVNFVEQQPYVDYLVGIKLFRSDDPLQAQFEWVRPQDDGRGYRVSTIQADSVLVAAREHVIDIINDIDYEPTDFNGIDYMKIELDFIIN